VSTKIHISVTKTHQGSRTLLYKTVRAWVAYPWHVDCPFIEREVYKARKNQDFLEEIFYECGDNNSAGLIFAQRESGRLRLCAKYVSITS